MKKDEIKEKLRPIIKECIMEMLLEEGLLSSIISECVTGVVSTQQLISEQQNYRQQPQQVVSNQNNTVPLFKQNSNKEREDIKRKREEFKQSMGVLKGAFDNIDVEMDIPKQQPVQQMVQESYQAPSVRVQGMGSSEKMADPTRGLDPSDPGINMEQLMDPAVINAWRGLGKKLNRL